MIEVVNYKNRVASRYMMLTKEILGLRVAEVDKYWVSIKIDGHFAGLHVKDGKAAFYNRSGKLLSLPLLEKEAAGLFPSGDHLFAGELHVHDESKRMRSFQVSEALANPDKFDLRFTVFDRIVRAEEPIPTVAQLEVQFAELFKKGDKIKAIEYLHKSSRKEINACFEELVEEQGYEGIVIRTEEGHAYKAKLKHTFDVVIVGFSEGTDDQTGKLRNVLLGMKYPDNQIQIVGKAGTGFNDEQRVALLAKFRTMIAQSEYIEVTEKQTAFEFIRPEVVVEISVLDLLTEEVNQQVTKMCLSYSAELGYEVVSARPSVNFISPVFLGLREDKTADSQDVRFSQITDLVELSAVADLYQNNPEQSSQIIRREVYVKEGKGEVMVRKLVAWKTNKEHTGKYPAYVLAYTDFSPNRVDKLQQDLAIGETEKEIEEQFEAYLTENIKKGWVKAGE